MSKTETTNAARHAMLCKALAKGLNQCTILVDEEQTRISRAIDDAALVASMAERESVKFPVRLTITLEPCGDHIRVNAGIGYGVRHAVKCDVVSVDNSPELPLSDTAGEGA